MKKILLIAAIFPVFLLAGQKNYSQVQIMNLRECVHNAVVYGQLQGLSKEQILGQGGYGTPDPIYNKALLDCDRQIKKYGMVWDMPYEREIAEARAKQQRSDQRKQRYRERQEDKNLLGTF